MFAAAENAEQVPDGRGESGLLPFWGLSDGAGLVKDERYVYLYPFSGDESRYRDLMEKVYRYRAVLGQPDQEELLYMIEGLVDAGEIADSDLEGLFINLCPFARKGSDGQGASER